MRFLVSEKYYETPLAAGKYRYMYDDAPTGVTEQWRYTLAPHEFTILRVDYDAREAGGGSILYHLIQQPDGALERLTYRFIDQDGSEVAGNVLFSAETITNSRGSIDNRIEETLSPMPFFFESAAGLGLLARQIGRQRELQAAALLETTTDASNPQFLAVAQIEATIQPQRTRELVIVPVGKTAHQTTYLSVGWQAQSYKIWRDQHQWPLKVQRGDGVVAQAIQYINLSSGLQTLK